MVSEVDQILGKVRKAMADEMQKKLQQAEENLAILRQDQEYLFQKKIPMLEQAEKAREGRA